MLLLAVCTLVLSPVFAEIRGLDEEFQDNSHLLSVFPESDDHHGALQDILAQRGSCELLKYPRIQGIPVDILCHGEDAREMKNHLERLQLPFTSSRSELPDDEDNGMDDGDEPALNQHIRFNKNNRYDKIQKYLRKLTRDYPAFVKMMFASFNQSYEGRNLTYLKIGTSPQKENTKMVWIDAGIHAREWISVTTALYTIDRLVRVFKKKSESGSLNENEKHIVGVDWLVMPLLNPDGYEYSHTDSSFLVRMWRKNRSPQDNNCFGVDLNRNFDVVGFGIGANLSVSNYSCDYTYVGKAGASELEVKMVSEVVMQNKDNIKVALSLHCYGAFILTPWGYQHKPPADSERMVDFGKRLYSAIKKVSPHRNYTVGALGEIFFYTAGGSTLDYFKAKAGIPFVATIELPGHYTNGTAFPHFYGFHTPKSQRLLIGKEIWAAMSEVAKTAKNEPLGSPNP